VESFTLEDLRFRPFREGDLAEMEEMSLALHREDPSGEGMSREKIRRTAEELRRRPDKGAILLFCAGRVVVGYAILIHFWSNECGGDIEIIDELYVKPSWRGKGICTAFLDHLSGVGGGPVNMKGLKLEVTPANERAHAYYLRQGFEPVRNRHLVKKLPNPARPGGNIA